MQKRQKSKNKVGETVPSIFPISTNVNDETCRNTKILRLNYKQNTAIQSYLKHKDMKS